MTEATEPVIPPYPSYATFDNCIKSLVKTGVPNRIDKSLFPTISGGAQSSLLGALRYLNLISENGAPRPQLSQLVTATGAERAKILEAVITSAYGFIFDGGFDLAKASPGELAERFKAQRATGGTLEKAISFFLGAAASAAIPVSPHIMQHKHAGNSGGQKRPRAAQRRRQQPQNNGADNQRDNPSLNGDLTSQLVGKFPTFDPTWDDPIKAKWFEGFQQLVGVIENPRKRAQKTAAPASSTATDTQQ